MLRINQSLINLREQEEKLKKQLDDAIKKRREIQEIEDKWLNECETKLINQINTLFLREQYKFKAKLSDDKEFIEVYSTSNQKVGVYAKVNGEIRPVGLVSSCANEVEDVIFGRYKQQMYNIFKSVFR